MNAEDKFLEMLTSQNKSVRSKACEWLRTRQESSPEIVRALERASYDGDKEVAERAKYALQADVHHQMAIELGIVRPDHTKTKRKIPAPRLRIRKIRAGSIIASIIGTISVIAGFGSFVSTLSYQWQTRNSESWPTTRGEVISADIKTYNNEYGDNSYPEITYQYTVSGIEYSCEIMTSQLDIYRKLPVGSRVTVFYDPDRPKVCVSEYDTDGFPWGSMFCIALGSFFVWFGYEGLFD